MADKWAVQSGPWSDTATWNSGALPLAGDDVFADGFTVTIDQNVAVLSLRTSQRSGGTAGGGFAISSNRTIAANVIAGTTPCLTMTAGDVAITGNVTGGTATSAHGVSQSGGNLTVTGNVMAAQANVAAHGISLTTGFSSLTINGNVLSAGTAFTTVIAHGIQIASGGGSATVNGNVSGSVSNAITSGTLRGVNHAGTGLVTINGNVTGGGGTSVSTGDAAGASVGSTGTMIINGNVTGGVASGTGNTPGALLAANGVLVVNGDVFATETSNGVRPTAARGLIRHNGHQYTSNVGMVGIGSGRVLIHDTNAMKAEYRRDIGGSPGTIRLLGTENSGIFDEAPAPGDVRAGVVYGESTGTLAVPPPGSVALGVPIDNTVGTAFLTQANIEAAIVPTIESAIASEIETQATSTVVPAVQQAISQQTTALIVPAIEVVVESAITTQVNDIVVPAVEGGIAQQTTTIIVPAVQAAVAAVVAGDGDTPVNHDTGTPQQPVIPDNLRFVSGGVGIDNATIRAFLKSDYDAGIFSMPRGRAVTRSDGRWVAPMFLNAGMTYVITFEKPGIFAVSTKEITVPGD